MPNSRIDIAKYTHYFNINAPSAKLQLLLLLAVGAAAGMASGLIIHSGISSAAYYGFLLSAAVSGIMIIALPAVLTAILIKGLKWRMKLKHAMFAALSVSLIYALAIVAIAVVYSVFDYYILASVMLILGNAGIYGYWFFINRVAIGQRRGSILIAAVQPVLNLLFYIPFGKYLFTLDAPLNAILLKLYAGMAVFLAVGYAIIYAIDRPAKKELNISGVAVFSAMVQQWLLDINPKADFLGNAGTERDVDVDVMVLKGAGSGGAIFVKPDIHYGPFSNVGGSTATEQFGRFIEQKYGAVPFIMHGAVNAGDNPVSVNQIYMMKKRIGALIDGISNGRMKAAEGAIGRGIEGSCRAVNIRINGTSLVLLSKSPLVTEDIDRGVGLLLESAAGRDRSKVILIDAHNSRFESAPEDELRGIYRGSKYVKSYRKAIMESAAEASGRQRRLRFGAAGMRIKKLLPDSKDLGWGYTSVGVFEFGTSRFAIIYVDSNNMLPEFRDGVVNHMKDAFGLEAEICTTDTHSVNSIALNASNSLGRETWLGDFLPVLDRLVGEAEGRLEPVAFSHGTITLRGFRVWGRGADELLLKASKDAIRIFKHVVPFIVAAGFVAAAWLIYIV